MSYNLDVRIYLYSGYQARYRARQDEMHVTAHDRTPPRRPWPELKTPKGRVFTEVIERKAGEKLRPNGKIEDYIIQEITFQPALKPLPVTDPFDL